MDNAYLEDPWSSTPSSIEMRKSTMGRSSQLEDERDSLRSTLRGLPYVGKVLPATRIVRRLLSIPNSPRALFKGGRKHQGSYRHAYAESWTYLQEECSIEIFLAIGRF
jgi:hypothetical protein